MRGRPPQPPRKIVLGGRPPTPSLSLSRHNNYVTFHRDFFSHKQAYKQRLGLGVGSNIVLCTMVIVFWFTNSI